MDMGAIGVAIAGSSAVGAALLYVVRSELRGDVTRIDGRINTHERGCTERQKNLDERHEAITDTLKSIDHKLDKLMGHGV